MGKYFGTDGVRGKANVTLNVERAFQIGQALGYLHSSDKKAKIIVGKDTRLSGSMFECAIAAGATSTGADVYLLGTCPTPSVAYLTISGGFDCGVMISASHNPYYDNGIKVFNKNGEKLDAITEERIEDYIDNKYEIDLKNDVLIGQVIDFKEGLDDYLAHIASLFKTDFSGLKVVVDCANGSSVTTAEKLLTKLNAECTVIHNEPNGLNINANCGSTHPDSLQKVMKNGDFDLGIAFDGDADRCIAVNKNGDLLDGDYILYICGRYLKSINQLANNTIVSTVMANLGFFIAMKENNIESISTQVGDKYVYECMVNDGHVLGGEQSGHIIFKNHATTGDGLLTACKLLEIMKLTNKSIEELSEGLSIFPQLLVNVKVENKEAVLNDERILAEIKKVSEELNDEGRILVRPSGTEPLIRVMVEAKTDELCNKYVYRIVDLMK